MEGCQIAQDNMIPDLKDIWQICFGGCKEEIDLFYKTLFNINNAIVYVVNEKPVCSLYLLDMSVMQGGSEVPGCYVYAAGTLPEYRGNGYMSKLIFYAETLALKRGKGFLALLPANEGLYKFYGKLGFERFFKVKRVTLNADEMLRLSSAVQKQSCDFTFEDVYNVRRKVFNHDGDALWKKSHIEYAVKINKLYGGKIFSVDSDYAVCTKGENEVEISECTASGHNLSVVIHKIRKWHRCDKYNFRLPVYSNFFEKNSIVDYFGMIKPLKMNNIYYDGCPYLGLALE